MCISLMLVFVCFFLLEKAALIYELKTAHYLYKIKKSMNLIFNLTANNRLFELQCPVRFCSDLLPFFLIYFFPFATATLIFCHVTYATFSDILCLFWRVLKEISNAEGLCRFHGVYQV